MASWILVSCLVSLRNEFNALAPARDKSSDGSIGDSAHAQSSSDHNPDETGATPYEDADDVNEVHAIDVDATLRKAGWSMNRAVGVIVTRHRTGADDRLQNVIYNRRIWSRSWGWTARQYTGSNPHDKHAHFSSRYTTAQERDTRRWGLLEDDDQPGQESDTMSVQDVADYFAAIARSVDGTASDAERDKVKTWRTQYAAVARFGWGLNFADQTNANLAPGQFARVGAAIAALDQVDEEAVAAAITPALVAAIGQLDPASGITADQVKDAVRDVLLRGAAPAGG